MAVPVVVLPSPHLRRTLVVHRRVAHVHSDALLDGDAAARVGAAPDPKGRGVLREASEVAAEAGGQPLLQRGEERRLLLEQRRLLLEQLPRRLLLSQEGR